jgi:hypothetical protein
MPAKVKEAHDALWLDYANGDKLTTDGQRLAYNNHKKLTREAFAQQAARTAWKIVQDWIEVQMSMIQMKQADTLEVFMPYIWDGHAQKTIYQIAQERGFAGLLPEKTESQP